MTDGWTSIYNQHYIPLLTVHFINLNTKLCSRLIGCIIYNEKCSSAKLAPFLLNITKIWNIENKVLTIVTDNAPNIKLAVQMNN